MSGLESPSEQAAVSFHAVLYGGWYQADFAAVFYNDSIEIRPISCYSTLRVPCNGTLDISLCVNYSKDQKHVGFIPAATYWQQKIG